MKRFLRFEGGHIGVKANRRGTAAWYEKHLGLREVYDSEVDGQTLLAFPRAYAIAIVSIFGGTDENVWGGDRKELHAGPVRLCLESPDLTATHAALVQEGVHVTPVSDGPGGVPCFDFYDLNDTRLTAVAASDPDSADAGARFTGYASPRFGVANLDEAISFYEAHLGAKVERRESGVALLSLGDFLPVWLEEVPGYDFSEFRHHFARPYFVTPDIDEAHEYATKQGFMRSPVYGAEGALQVFHFHDNSGNDIPVWSYPGVTATFRPFEAGSR